MITTARVCCSNIFGQQAAPGKAAVSFWETPRVLPAASKMAGSCRFRAQREMIIGKKLPFARAGASAVAIWTSFWQ